MESKIFLALFIVFLAPFAKAIVIVPPTIYFATISVATFAANAFIGLLAWIALSGLFNKKFFGKRLSEIFSRIFSAMKKIFIAIFSMLAAVFVVNPIEVFSIIEGAVVAAIVCGALLFLSNYSSYRSVEIERKKNLLKSTAVFSLIVLLLFGASAYSSLEIKILPQGKPLQGAYGNVSDYAVGLPDMVQKIGQNLPTAPSIGAPLGEGQKQPAERKDIEAGKEKVFSGELWFFPKSSNECRVKVGSQNFSFKPQFNCYFLGNGVPLRVFCPVKISANEVNQKGTAEVTAGGSCTDNGTVEINGGFGVGQN